MTPRMKQALFLLAEKNDRAFCRLHSGLWFRESDAEAGSHRWEKFREDERPYYGGFLWNVPGEHTDAEIVWIPDTSNMALTTTIQALVRRGLMKWVGRTKKEQDGYVGHSRAVLTDAGIAALDALPAPKPPSGRPHLRLVKGGQERP